MFYKYFWKKNKFLFWLANMHSNFNVGTWCQTFLGYYLYCSFLYFQRAVLPVPMLPNQWSPSLCPRWQLLLMCWLWLRLKSTWMRSLRANQLHSSGEESLCSSATGINLNFFLLLSTTLARMWCDVVVDNLNLWLIELAIRFVLCLLQSGLVDHLTINKELTYTILLATAVKNIVSIHRYICILLVNIFFL